MRGEAPVLALSGGVGGAKLVRGLANVLTEGRLHVACNTGDDFEHLGLLICPDFDTVIYTLSGLVHSGQGWGRADETWQVLGEVAKLGGPSWFRLGDRDIALHLLRRQALDNGMSLEDVATLLCDRLGLTCSVFPASNERVRTLVHSDDGILSFQEYFVRDQCEPKTQAITFDVDTAAKPAVKLNALLTASDNLAAIIFCPSNPYLSLDPILAVPTLRQRISASRCPRIAVSPIIGGSAIKGPTAKIMTELEIPVNPLSYARHLDGLIDALVIDHRDADYVAELEADGLQVFCEHIIMSNEDDKLRLAKTVMRIAEGM